MIDPATLPAFLLATAVIMIAPGPDMMFMIGTGISSGPKGGVAAAFGVTAGVSVYVIGSALGLAALIDAQPAVLTAVHVLGAGYLMYLALATWQEASDPQTVGTGSTGSTAEIFRRGFTVNIMNPKVALFIAAFIPRFVDPSRGRSGAQFLILAVSFQLVGLAVDLVIGVAAGSVRRLILDNPKRLSNMSRFAAGVYLLIAAWLVSDVVF